MGLALGTVGVAGAYAMQGRMLYMPTRHHDAHPSHYAGMGYRDVHLRAADGTMLHAWLVRDKLAVAAAATPPPPDVLLIHLHGNAGNISHRLGGESGLLGMIRALAPVCRLHVLLLDYRGYGASDAVEPDESGLRADAAAALGWAHDAVRNGQFGGGVFVLGRSLGGAVAAAMCEDAGAAGTARGAGERGGEESGGGGGEPEPALRRVLRGVMLENTFSSIEEMVAVHYAPLVPVVAAAPWLLRSKWRTRERLPLLGGNMPTLMLSGRRDDVVPPQQMDALHAAAARVPDGSASPSVSAPAFVAFERGGHNDTFLQPGYLDAVRDFVRDNMHDCTVATEVKGANRPDAAGTMSMEDER